MLKGKKEKNPKAVEQGQQPKKMKKAKKDKKSKKEKEVYVPIRGLIGNAVDYHVYDMSTMDKLTGFCIGFGIGFAIVYVFFINVIVALIAGVIVGIKAIPMWQEYLRRKRQRELLLQFKDMLESLVSSFSSGKNTASAFADAYVDMKDLYGETAAITKELELIYVGMQQNIILEDLLSNFAKRSGLEDVESFGDVFVVCNRRGGNMKDIIADTRNIIGDKIEIEMNIETAISAAKNELHIMMVMPLIVCMVSRSLVESNGANIITVAIKIVALGIFFAAYKMGKKVTDIKV